MGNIWIANLSDEDIVQEQRRKQKEGKIAVSSERRRERRRRLGLFVKHYWHRLVGAAVGWFAWDFYYCKPQTSLILSLYFQPLHTPRHAGGCKLHLSDFTRDAAPGCGESALST